MQSQTNTFVVMPSRRKEDQALSFEQMLNTGIAEGFRGTVKRVKNQRFIVIVDVHSERAMIAEIHSVTEHINPESKISRVDVKFGIAKKMDWQELSKHMVFHGQANTRYIWLTGYYR